MFSQVKVADVSEKSSCSSSQHFHIGDFSYHRGEIYTLFTECHRGGGGGMHGGIPSCEYTVMQLGILEAGQMQVCNLRSPLLCFSR